MEPDAESASLSRDLAPRSVVGDFFARANFVQQNSIVGRREIEHLAHREDQFLRREGFDDPTSGADLT